MNCNTYRGAVNLCSCVFGAHGHQTEDKRKSANKTVCLEPMVTKQRTRGNLQTKRYDYSNIAQTITMSS